MNVSLPSTRARAHADAAVSVEIPQYSRRAIFAIWAAAALPLGGSRVAGHPLLAPDEDGDEDELPDEGYRQ